MAGVMFGRTRDADRNLLTGRRLQRLRVSPLLVEIAVIVVGILLAFSIDAWWANVGRRSAEREALRSLARDFEIAAQLLERQIAMQDSAKAAGEALVQLTGPVADSSHEDSLAVLIPRVIRLPNFRPPAGTMASLMGSGDLKLISNDSLRAALAAYPSRLEDLNQTEGYAAQVVFGQLLPLLNRYLVMRRFGLEARGESRFGPDVVGLLRSMEFENLVQNRLMNVMFVLAAQHEMLDHIKNVRQMIRAQLEG